MSSHPSAPCPQTAPVDNMDIKTTIPAKRGPEDEVQFVSVQPVKKFRGSRESPPAQQSQHACGSSNIVPQDHLAAEARAFDTPPSTTGGRPPTSEPQPEADMLGHGVSLPSMETYVFPPPPNALPARTSHSSPMLSPRQLPPPRLSTQTHTTGPTPSGVLAAPIFSSSVPPRDFHVPWGMAGLYPQPAPLHTALTLHRPLLLPPVQPQLVEPPASMQNHEQQQSRPAIPDMPEPRPTLPQASEPPELQRTSDIERARASQMGIARTTTEPTRTSQSLAQQAQHPPTLTQAASQTPLQPERRPQSQNPTAAPPSTQTQTHPQTSTAGSNMVSASQSPATKPPCLVCEQMRQHALFNQTNGYPVVHHPHMQHGWHGPAPGPHQLQMPHPPQIGAGFGMRPHMPHTFPSRYQPGGTGHVPMGYVLPQLPFQVPIQMPRPLPVATATTAAAAPSTEVSPGQQTFIGQIPHFTPGTAHPTHPQYSQGILPTLQQPGMAQRPAMVASPQPQAPAAPPTPPSPAAHPPAQAPPAAPPQPEPRKPSPNLIVDIAETCEEVFPWDEVARRHGVPRQKVVDTFSAIIQLPLLRCTTDRKRHGKLATSRLREYTKAKKDAEAGKPATATPAARTPSPSPTSAPAVNPFPTNQDGAVLPGVLEMASTVAPLGLPSTLTNGLSGPWQR